ncbi:MAG: hypothetical protein K6E75_12205 [Lachnospiraceae bacterium]|nr:hypothetical protein [Lachnospiraceae bacterium]
MKKRIAGSKLHKVLDRRGIAMTEVLISFLLLTIIFAILYNCVHFASNMMMRAADMDRENAVFEEEATKKLILAGNQYNGGTATVSMRFVLISEDGGAPAVAGEYDCGVKTKSISVPNPDDESIEIGTIPVYAFP